MTADIDDLDAAAERYMQSVDAALRTMAARTGLTPEQKLKEAEDKVGTDMLYEMAIRDEMDAAAVGKFVANVQFRARQIRAKRPAAANVNEA